MSNVIQVLIVDDSMIHIEGIKAILKFETDMIVSGEARNSNEVKHQLESGAAPDVILLDVSLEEEYDGLELAQYLNTTFPGLKIIIISHYKEMHYIIKALNARVRAYMAKDSSPADIINAIRAVMSGNGIYFGETISYDMLLKGFGCQKNIQRGKPYELGGRELDVLKMLSSGYAAKEIAAKLGINVNTVESHKEHIKNKLGVNTIMEAVVFAVKQNLW